MSVEDLLNKKKGMTGKVSFTPDEMETLKRSWRKSQEQETHLSEEIGSQRRKLDRQKMELDQASRNSTRLTSELQKTNDEKKQLNQKLVELSHTLKDSSSEGWKAFGLAEKVGDEREITLKLSSINEIISENGSIRAINGIQIRSELTAQLLVACIERQNSREKTAEIEAVMNHDQEA